MQLFATHDVVHILGEVVGEAGQQVLVDVEGGGEGAEAASPGRDTQGQDVAGQGACRVVERKHRIMTSAANRLIGEVVQSRRRPLLGPSPS